MHSVAPLLGTPVNFNAILYRSSAITATFIRPIMLSFDWHNERGISLTICLVLRFQFTVVFSWTEFISLAPVSLLCCAYIKEKMRENISLSVRVSADTVYTCSCATTLTRFLHCVQGALEHVCVIVTYWICPYELCSLQCSRGPGATHLSFLVLAVGHSYGDPDWQSLLNPGGRTRLIGPEQTWGRVEMKDKEVCLRVYFIDETKVYLGYCVTLPWLMDIERGLKKWHMFWQIHAHTVTVCVHILNQLCGSIAYMCLHSCMCLCSCGLCDCMYQFTCMCVCMSVRVWSGCASLHAFLSSKAL